MTEMMIDLYADVLNNLDPSIASCMDTALKQHSQPLLMLLELHQISLQFQQNLDSLYVFNNGKFMFFNYFYLQWQFLCHNNTFTEK